MQSVGYMSEQISAAELEDFCVVGGDALAWVAEYLGTIRKRRVLPPTAPGDLLAVLPRNAPEQGESLRSIFEDFTRSPITTQPIAITRGTSVTSARRQPPQRSLAICLPPASNANLMLWRTAPAATEIEERVADWLRDWLELPGTWRGISYEGWLYQHAACAGSSAPSHCARRCRTRVLRPAYCVRLRTGALLNRQGCDAARHWPLTNTSHTG